MGMTEFSPGRFALHLNAARKERGIALNLAVFDESKHPRLHGKFTKGSWHVHRGSEAVQILDPTPHDGGGGRSDWKGMIKVKSGMGARMAHPRELEPVGKVKIKKATPQRGDLSRHGVYVNDTHVGDVVKRDHRGTVTSGRIKVGETSDKRWDHVAPAAESRGINRGFTRHDAVSALVVDHHKDQPEDVGSDVNKAADLLSAGKKVQLSQPREASVLLEELAKRVHEAKAKGDKAPTFDLCKVTVRNTNLFCAESKGIKRVRMPQLSGKPTPGSKADKLPKNDKGEVDLTDKFVASLKSQGHSVTPGTEKSAHLRPSQIELNGGKVAGMVKSMEAGTMKPGGPTLVSHDNYIVDGHHRWAANVGHDIADNKAGDINQKVNKIGLDIVQLLDSANQFAKEWGIPQAAV